MSSITKTKHGGTACSFTYVKHEIVTIASKHDSPIIFLNSPNYTIWEKFVLIKDYIDGLPFTIAHDNFDECNMHVVASPTCNYYERGTISPPLYVSNMIKLQEGAASTCILYLSKSSCVVVKGNPSI